MMRTFLLARKGVYALSLALGMLWFVGILVEAESAPAAVGPVAEGSGLMVRYERGLLTVQATNVEVDRLLREVTKKSGVPLALGAPLQALVSVAFAEQPLEVGLHAILRSLQSLGHVSSIMVYDAATVTRLRIEIHAKAAGSSGTIPPPPGDMTTFKEVPITHMEKAQPASGAEKLHPMERAQPTPGFDMITPMGEAQPASGSEMLIPQAPPLPGKQKSITPQEEVIPPLKKDWYLTPMQQAPWAQQSELLTWLELPSWAQLPHAASSR